MSGFMYYIPDGQASERSAAYLRSIGLGYAFSIDTNACPVPVTRGPFDGPHGVVVADPDSVRLSEIGFYPETQDWRRIPGNDSNVCVGMYLDNKPAPHELQRRTMVEGHPVMLRDGMQWVAPIARECVDAALHGRSNLPSGVAYDEDGRWTAAGVDDEYIELWAIAQRWWNAKVEAQLISGDDINERAKYSVPFQDIGDNAVRALSANYRVGAVEIAMLNLFDMASMVEVLDALIDWPTVMDIVKKKMERPISTA